MIFSEILATVKDTVRRPDLDSWVDQRVLAAISACHSEANCILDRTEFVIAVTGGAATIGVAPMNRDIRTLETVVGLDATGAVVQELPLKSAMEVLKLRRMNQDTGTSYVADGGINFKASVEVTSILATGYLHRLEPSILLTAGSMLPLTTPAIANYHSWLMDVYPIAIIDYAVGYIEQLKGNTELGRSMLLTYNELHAPFIRNLSAGYAGM